MAGYSIPTHEYIGRRKCGCLCTLIADVPELKSHIAKEVRAAIADGVNITRIERSGPEWESAMGEAKQYFLACHCDIAPVGQMKLF